MAKGIKNEDDVDVRDYINKYGGSTYGIKDSDIGWLSDPNQAGGGSVTLGGKNLAAPSYNDNGNTFMNESALRDAIDRYASGNGLKTQSSFQMPEAPAAYQSPYASEIDSLLNDIRNTGSFEFNPEENESFKAYKKVYNNEGNRAFTNSMGEAAGLTGGRLNSYAVTAGSQARDVWSDRLMARVPELEQLAYNMYMGDISNKLQNLNALQNQDNTAYGRHRDTIGDFQTDRNFNYGVGRDERTDFENDRNYNFDVGRADRSDFETDRAFDYGVDRDKIMDKQWLDQFTADEKQRIVSNALQNKQISISEANAALNREQFNWQKDPTNPDNLYKAAQIENMNSPVDYKEDPSFADDIAYINSNKEQAYNKLIANSKAFMDQYGYDGYKELLRVAKPDASEADLDKILSGIK
jgi:hypothetical protein